VYPVTDFTRTSESRMTLGTGFFLTRKAIEQAADRYIPDPAQRGDVRASVLNGTITPKTPPTLVVTAGFDPLHDEGAAYAKKLTSAGISTEYLEFGDMIHGFFNQATVGRRGPQNNREIGKRVGKALA
jgi:acetyl esterase